jgi:hypothetical protein
MLTRMISSVSLRLVTQSRDKFCSVFAKYMCFSSFSPPFTVFYSW